MDVATDKNKTNTSIDYSSFVAQPFTIKKKKKKH